MTVQYNRTFFSASVSSSLLLLLKWKGSIWKSAGLELIVWLCVWSILQGLLLVFQFDPEKHDGFYVFIQYCQASTNSLPIIMLLSFFVTKAFDRWQSIFKSLAYIEDAALLINATVTGEDEHSRICRLSIIRHLCLTQVLVYRDISLQVKRRFPTLHTICAAGFMTKRELGLLEVVNCAYNKFWVPITWANNRLRKAKEEGRIVSDPGYISVLNKIYDFREKLVNVYNFDCTPVPLAYPQIVSLAVRFYIIMHIIGNQMLSMKDGHTMGHNYFFFIKSFELLSVLSWMKVGEALLNPLGDDDDDLELNHIIDKNFAIGMQIVNSRGALPPLEGEDQSGQNPMYPENAVDLGGRKHNLKGSAVDLKVDAPSRMVVVDASENVKSRKRTNKIRDMFATASNSLGNHGKVFESSASRAPGLNTLDVGRFYHPSESIAVPEDVEMANTGKENMDRASYRTTMNRSRIPTARSSHDANEIGSARL